MVKELLLKTLQGLLKEPYATFQWYLSMEVLAGCEPIPECELENATRIVTVNKMIAVYGEEKAVMVTEAILRKMSNNNAAEKLMKQYAEVKTAAPAAPPAPPGAAAAPPGAAAAPPGAAAAPPGAMSAQQGSVIIAPSFTGSTAGPVTINIHK